MKLQKNRKKSAHIHFIHITVRSKTQWLQPSGSQTENQKIPTYKPRNQNYYFQQHNKLFEVR